VEKYSSEQVDHSFLTKEQLLMEKLFGIDEIPCIRQAIAQAENMLGADGRVVVRYSWTQPLLRIMIEGPTKEKTTQCAGIISSAARKGLSLCAG
jgi:phosphomannomutase